MYICIYMHTYIYVYNIFWFGTHLKGAPCSSQVSD